MSDGTTDDAAANGATDEPPTEARARSQRSLTRAVLRLANRLHGVLQGAGREDLAARVGAEAERWSDTALTVIVAGEIKRGKSSLLNSLAGIPDVLPVDADVATAVHLVVRHGEERAAFVTRLDEVGEPETFPVGLHELADYASMRGDEARRRGVSSVDVRVDAPLLARGLVLVDTPGVGGMTRGHRDVTLAALQRADALLFTVSAQEPVSRTELEFLAEASERIDRVIFVITKTDLNTDETNERLLAENREKLAAFHAQLRERAAAGDERAGELHRRFDRLLEAPFVATSSFLADQAARRAAAGREEQAERLRQRSGLGPLQDMLERSIDAREDLRLANILQLCSTLLVELEREASARVRTVDGDGAVEDEVRARMAELEELAGRQARWRSTLASSIQRMQTEAGRRVSRELNLVRNHYKQMIEAHDDPSQLVEELAPELERSLHAAWNNLADLAQRDFGEMVGNLVGGIGVEGLDAVLGDLQVPPGFAELVEGAGADARFNVLDDALPVAMQTYTFANITNAAVGTLGLATGGLGLLAYGVGAAISYPINAMRRKQRERQRAAMEFQRLLNESLFGNEGIAKEFTTELTLRIIDAREQLEQLVEQRLVTRRKELEQQAKELQQLARAEAGRRTAARKEAEARMAELQALRKEVEQLQTGVHESLANTRRREAPGTPEPPSASEGST